MLQPAVLPVGPDAPVVVLSQRGPLSFSVDPTGGLAASPSPGGLANALGGVARRRPVRWVAAAISEGDCLAARQAGAHASGAAELRLVELPAAVQQLHYATFANPILWFLQHGLPAPPPRIKSVDSVERAWAEGYCPANALLAQRAAEVADGVAPVVLVQDYHLYLAPRLIRQAKPDARVAHFLHIPWPEPERWAALPQHIVTKLLEGLLGADVAGFQSDADAGRFRSTIRAYLPQAAIDTDGAVTGADGRRTLVRHYPITVDTAELEQLAASREAVAHASLLAERKAAGMQTILRVDRLDPSKNIAAGFEAFGRLLAGAPELRGRVTFMAHLVPTRTEVPEYQEERKKVFAAAAAVNGRFGAQGWQPIEILNIENRIRAVASLSEYDVLLVNSLADGMNLVAKEGAVLNRRDGVVVLSRRTGAWDELGEWAIGVDPEDIAGTAKALHRALLLPQVERRLRATGLRQAVMRSSLDRWLDDQLQDLPAAPKEAFAKPQQAVMASR